MRHIFLKIKLLFRILSYLNRKKIYSFIWLNVSYLLSRIGIHYFPDVRPWFVSVELAAFCNLRCPECPTGQRMLSRKGNDVFSEDLFRSFVDSNKEYLLHLILYFQGEPLLNKNLPKMIDYAHRAGIFTSISTNAQLINDQNAKTLVQSGLDKIIISIDGTTQEVYEQYRVGGKLEKAFDAIRSIIYQKKEHNSFSPVIELQMIVFSTNEHQIDEMRAIGKKLGVDRVVFKTAQLYDFENGHELLPSNDKYARYRKLSNGRLIIKNKLHNHCWRLWNGAVINVKGQVLPCCYDKDSEHSFGNIQDDDFNTIWQNKKASGFRASILQNRKQYAMCRNCTGK